jgi:hypothetical protein
VVYSSRLPEPELEVFCREDIEHYKQYYALHRQAIDEYDTLAILPFW